MFVGYSNSKLGFSSRVARLYFNLPAESFDKSLRSSKTNADTGGFILQLVQSWLHNWEGFEQPRQ